jgi:Na+/H+-dicarboxylate symporter
MKNMLLKSSWFAVFVALLIVCGFYYGFSQPGDFPSEPTQTVDTLGISFLIKSIEQGNINWTIVISFIVGMVLHWANKVRTKEIVLLANTPKWYAIWLSFKGWFWNKFHRTAITGVMGTITLFMATFGLPPSLFQYTHFVIVISVGAGWWMDSAFNDGTKKPSE